LAFAEGLFCFLNYFSVKEGFLILKVEYNLKVSSIYYFPLKRVKRGKRKNLSFR
jgi:hypothetical protein